MQLAIEEAHKAESMGEVPVGCLIVKDDQVIARGHNQCISDPSACSHAEVIAIQQACQVLGNYRLTGCKLYVTLEPCMMCAGAMVHARIDECIFGAFDPKTGVVSSVDELFNKPYLNHWVKSTGGVCERECADMLQSFFSKKRKQS